MRNEELRMRNEKGEEMSNIEYPMLNVEVKYKIWKLINVFTSTLDILRFDIRY